MPENNPSYALANPLSILLEKPPNDFQKADLLNIIEQRQIERITFHYTALDGRIKELKLPLTSRHQAELILAEGERVDGSSLFRGVVDTGLSDLYVVPEYKTAFLNPFDDCSLDFLCRFLTKDGERAPFALDNILKRACRLFRDNTDLDLYALGELEFYLIFERDPDIFTFQNQLAYHEAAPFIKSGEILNEIVRYISKITGAVKYSHSEVGFVDNIESDLDEIQGKTAEQLEVEFIPRPAEEMADILVLARWIIRNVAYKHGCVATFTPKIDEKVAGSGLHFHMALMKSGKNIMTDSDGKLSESALRLIGGLCEYAGSLTAFGNMVASSYLRLSPDHEAPTHICWSDLNRSTLIRVPLGWSNLQNVAKKINPQEEADIDDVESRQTIELRSPDGSALIHLLLAGIVIAAEWAIKDNRSLELAEKFYARENTFKDKNKLDNFPLLPSSCTESSQILIKKRNLYERDGIFPQSIIEYVAGLLKEEDVALVSQGLIYDVKKIMYKDLHRH